LSRGALLIARNNSQIDYIKQAVFAASRIKKYMDIPVSVLTDNSTYLTKKYPNHPFDKILKISDEDFTFKKYNDGIYARKSLEFKNTSRFNAYDLTPYTETLLLDTDYIVSNDLLNECFSQEHGLMMYKDATDFSRWRDLDEFKFISETGPTFYWATCVFFKKSDTNKCFFDLVKHIQEHWQHYRNVYQITSAVFRNDFAFSIAAHIMNGHVDGGLIKPMPGKKHFITDRDHVEKIDEEDFLFLIEKENTSEHFPVKFSGNVHIMNKFGLNRIIDDLN
jgi:hypothetical protein